MDTGPVKKLEQARGEKRPPRNGTGYHPHFVEYSRTVLCVIFEENKTLLDKPTPSNLRVGSPWQEHQIPTQSVRPYYIIHITGTS